MCGEEKQREVPVCANPFGKTSRLSLIAGKKDGKSMLQEVSFTAPFKIMEPFWNKDNSMRVMLLSASAGIMEGDTQEFSIRVKDKAAMEFSSQAYEKIHRMKQGKARRRAEIFVGKESFLKYAPLPVIPFADSAFESQVEIELEDESAQLVYQDVLSCGRAARGERFAYRRFYNLVDVRQRGRLLYRDNTRLEPGCWDLPGIGMYEGYTHLGNLLLFHVTKELEWIKRVREFLDNTPNLEGGVTVLESGDLAVRVLGMQGEQVWSVLEEIQKDAF